MFTILLNDEQYTDNLLSADFSIQHRVREYSASFKLFVHKSLLSKIKPSVDIKIYINEKLAYGGIIHDMKLNRLDEDYFVVEVSGAEYTVTASRRTIYGQVDLEPDPANYKADEKVENNDRNRTGKWAKRYLELFLQEEGITEGEIYEGGRMAETDLFEFDTMSITEIYNELANVTGDDWHIGPDKKLYFGSTGYNKYHHTQKERQLTEKNETGERLGGFFDLEVSYTLTNYFNKIFLIGGMPDEENVSEENLNYDGDLKYVLELPDEINNMANLNNNTGVWGSVIRDENMTNLDVMHERATKELSKNGTIPIELRVSTFMDCFKPTDTLFVNLESWDINNQIFSVEEVEITTVGDKIMYTLTLVNRVNVEVRMEDFAVFMEKLVREAKKRGRDVYMDGSGEEDGGKDFAGLDEIPALRGWADLQDDGSFIMDDNGRILEIKDKITDATIFKTISSVGPKLIGKKGYYLAEFDYLDYSNMEYVGPFDKKGNQVYADAIFVYESIGVRKDQMDVASFRNNIMMEPLVGSGVTRSTTQNRDIPYYTKRGSSTLIGFSHYDFNFIDQSLNEGMYEDMDDSAARISGVSALIQPNYTRISHSRKTYNSDVGTINIGGASSGSYNYSFHGYLAEVIILEDPSESDIVFIADYLRRKYQVESFS